MKHLIFILLILLSGNSPVNAQFIDEILDYKPAPGQFINLPGIGTPDAALSIKGEDPGLVCLGSAGGYIIFRFDSPVVNDPGHPYGVDFTLFGNSLSEWAEPAAVYVMKDVNNNSLPDDKWYLLAGSDYYFSSSHKEHRLSYYEPESSDDDVSWKNNLGETGYLRRNAYHSQDYYPAELFSPSFYNDSCSFKFLKIKGKLETGSSSGVKSYSRAFGFADNRSRKFGDHMQPDNPYTWEAEGYGGDAFDLAWAVNENGYYVELDTADFIKVQTAMYGYSEAVGEVSTELTWGRLSISDPSVTGRNEMLVIEDVPEFIAPGNYPLQAHFFRDGRPVEDEIINWVSDNPEIKISQNGIAEVKNGVISEIHAEAKNGEIISNTVIIKGSSLTSEYNDRADEIEIFPNPAHDFIFLNGAEDAFVSVYNSQGILVKDFGIRSDERTIDISFLKPGIYFLSIRKHDNMKNLSLVKH